MRVLFVIHYPVFGGPHNQALLLGPSLAKHDVSFTVLLPDARPEERGDAVERLRAAGLDVVTVPLDRVRATRDMGHQMRFASHVYRDVQAIRKVIRLRDIDIVQVGGLVNPQAALAGRLENVRVIWQLLDTRPPMIVRRALMPLVRALSDVVMSTGDGVASVHPGTARLGDRLQTFFPPVDTQYFDSEPIDRDLVRREFGFGPEEEVLGTVGNLNPQKGHEHLVRAAALARKRSKNVRVLIVGASHDTHRSYETELYNLCRKLGLAIGRDVVFTGGLRDVRPALAAMDVFVLASVRRSEGAPTALEEAMMMKIPVVATDVGSVRELVEPGRTGFVVPAEDHAALAHGVLRILESPGIRRDFGTRARMVATARFSAEECARRHLSAYEYALAHRRAPARMKVPA